MARANSRYCCIGMQQRLQLASYRVTFDCAYAQCTPRPCSHLRPPETRLCTGGLYSLNPGPHTFKTIYRPRQFPVFGRNREVPIGGLPHQMTLLDHQLHRQNTGSDTKIMQFWSRYIKTDPAIFPTFIMASNYTFRIPQLFPNTSSIWHFL